MRRSPVADRRWRRPTAGGTALGVLATMIAVPGLLLGTAAPAAADGPVIGPDTGTAGPMSLTQTMDDRYGADLGQTFTGTVTVSQTTGLTRQRINVSWSGLRPGTDQVTAVVVMQCWGAPAEVTPQRCWFDTRTSDIVGLGMDPKLTPGSIPDPAVWGKLTESDPLSNNYIMPFTSRSGKSHAAMQAVYETGGLWPENFPPGGRYGPGVYKDPPADRSLETTNEVLAGGNSDGAGSRPFETLPAEDVPSLGCGATKVCSLVVIPIGPTGCRTNEELPPLYQNLANDLGLDLPGICAGADGLRGAESWLMPSQWDRRFVFPLSFRPTAAVCAADNRPESGTLGSPLLAPVMASWRPKFCQDRALFKLGYTDLPEGDARRQFAAALAEDRSDGPKALLTSRPLPEAPTRPLAYAPVAVDAFTVAYIIDAPDETGVGREVTKLRLNARLVAKLVTQSYHGYSLGYESPLKDNPSWWGADPEFIELNPGLNLPGEAPPGGTFPLLLQGDQDLVNAVTAYIANDPAAVAWLRGAADEWGMRVNRKFRDWSVPADQFELREDWVTPGKKTSVNGAVLWFNQLANSAGALRDAALAMVKARPTSTENPTIFNDPVTNESTVQGYSRTTAQQPGSRGLLAIMDSGNTAQFGLRSAELENPAGQFVAPTTAAMSYAMQTLRTDKSSGVSSVDLTRLDRRGYPGTMPIYAAVPTAGLNKTDAANYATFLDYAAGKGQQVGLEAGDLPTGYLPLPADLARQTVAAAAAVRDQTGATAAPGGTPPSAGGKPAGGASSAGGSGTSGGGGTTGGGTTGGGTGSAGAGNGAPGSVPTPGAVPKPGAAGTPSPAPAVAPANVATTSTDDSQSGRWTLPVLIALGLLAGMLAPVAAVASRPGHPLNKWVGRVGGALPWRRS
ncbi:hypothetical protein ACFY3U_25215 [Micromonospora sp. NPDC000089]|uniref:hypothetical protein n=1 Tax=unclassified Micromonospora TaxID=2617518 RepID=UPI0036A07E2F